MADDLSIRGKNGSNVRRFSRMRNGEQTTNANTRDPSRGIPQAPANFGRGLIPQIITFAGRSSTWAKIYRNPDAAIQNSRQNAESMRADTDIMECLEARQRGTSLLNWHLEPEDNKDPKQKQLVADLTDILEHTPRFTEYRRNLLDALWYGRTAVQHQYGWKKIKGKRRMTISHWLPIHGDKLVFRYDDGRGDYDDRSVGIRVGGQYNSGDIIAGNRKLEPTDWGLAYFLEPWERSLLAIHRHIIEDGAYENPLSAGRIHGVGIRDRIYWAWYQKQETLAHLMEVIQRTGTGFTIYWYQSGNAASEAKMTQIAQEQNSENVLVIPRSPDPSIEAEGIDRIEPNSGGIAILKEVVHEFFGHKIKRYIMGQVLSSESAATGLGSGVADLHQDTYYSIIAYDACGLEETITTDTVEPLKNFNFPWARDINIRFQIDTESNQSDKKMNALRQAWEIGARIKESEVMEIVGASIPSQDDYVLQNPSMMQQQRLWDQSQAQQQGPVDPAAAVGENPSVQDMFGPLLTQGPEGEEPQAGDEGGDQPPPQGPPSQGPAMYAKVKPQQGQSAFVWHEEDHPRDDAGKFTDKHTEEEHPAATAAAELPEGYSPSSYEVGRAGITKSQAMQQAMGDSKAKLARYDQMVKATYLYTGTKPEQWKAVPIEGMESVDNGQGGQVEMPRFSMPSGYQPVRTPHSNASGISDNACCELCGHNIKKAYYIQNDDHRLTMAVGSECVTNFGEGESGDRIAKKSQWAANRDLLKQAWEAFDRLGDAYAGRDKYGQHFLPTFGNDAYWRMLREMGVRNEKDVPAEKRQQIMRKANEVKKLYAELHGVLHNTAGAPVHHEGTTVKQTIWTGSGYNTHQREHTSRYDAASDAAITRWVKSNGDKVREMLERVDQLTGQGSTAMQVVSRYQRIRYQAPPSPLPGPPDHAATPGELQQHRVGETKSQNGHTYRLNENHRWERADDDASSDTVDMHGDNTELADDPASDHEKRLQFVQSQLSGTHEAVRGVMSAFHQSKSFLQGAEVATRDLHPKQADQLYQFLKQNAGARNQGKKVQGGWVCDLGEGRLGYASAAGSVVVWPPDQNGKRLVSYTARTAIVNKAGKLDESILPDGKQRKPKAGAEAEQQPLNSPSTSPPTTENTGEMGQNDGSTSGLLPATSPQPPADSPNEIPATPETPESAQEVSTAVGNTSENLTSSPAPKTNLPPELASLDDAGMHSLLKSLGVKTKKGQDRAALEKSVSDTLYGPRGYRPTVPKEKSERLKAAEKEAMKRLGINPTGEQPANAAPEVAPAEPPQTQAEPNGENAVQASNRPNVQAEAPAEVQPEPTPAPESASQEAAPQPEAPTAAHEAVAGSDPQQATESPEYKHGTRVQFPDSTSFAAFEGELRDDGKGNYTIHGVGDTNDWPRSRIPHDQIAQVVDDLHGHIRAKTPAEHPSVNAILNGKGKLLGRGNDGLAFDAGDGKVVKASSDMSFHWNNGVLRKGRGNENLAAQVAKNEELRKAGVPGLLPQELHTHEGRNYAVMPKVDTSAKITPEHIQQVANTLKELHNRGHYYGDEIQVGVDQNGNAMIYDTGSIRELDKNEHEARQDRESDSSKLRRFAEKHGYESDHLYPDPHREYYDTLDKWMEVSQKAAGKPGSRLAESQAEYYHNKLNGLYSKLSPEMQEFYSDGHKEEMGKLAEHLKAREQRKAGQQSAPQPEAPQAPAAAPAAAPPPAEPTAAEEPQDNLAKAREALKQTPDMNARGLAKHLGIGVREAMELHDAVKNGGTATRSPMRPKPVAAPKPAKAPRKTWRDNLEGHLKLHGIEPTPEHVGMIQKAMQDGHISDHAHLKTILKQAAKNHGKGDISQAITPHLTKAIDDRARRAEERTPRHTFDSRVKAAAKQFGLDEKDVAQHAQSLYDAHPDFGYQAQREAARKRARELTGLNANIQNSSGDAASKEFAKKDLARKGRQLASEFPTLGWGQGFGSDADANQDYESKMWELLKEGERQPPSMASDEFWNHVNDHLEGMRPQEPADKAEFSPEDELSEEDRQQLEEDLRNNRSRLNEWGEDTAIPFSKRGKAIKYNAWNEADHPRGQPENKGQFVEKTNQDAHEFGYRTGMAGKWLSKNDRKKMLTDNGFDLNKHTSHFVDGFNRGTVEANKAKEEKRKEKLKPFYDQALEMYSDDYEDLEPDEREKKIWEDAQNLYDDDQADREAEQERQDAIEAEGKRRRDDQEFRTNPEMVSQFLKKNADGLDYYLSNGDRNERREAKARIQLVNAHDLARANGWEFEYLSGSSSLYYKKGDKKLRISDHVVPHTDERSWNSQNGGFSWAGNGNQIILPVDDLSEELKSMDQQQDDSE